MNKNDIKFVNSIPGWLSINEGKFLEKATKITKSLNGEIVEIGSFCGKSTIWLAQSKQNVFAIDPHLGNIDSGNVKSTLKQFLANSKKAKVDKYIIPIVKTSKLASSNWKKPIKLLFIDGLHDEKNASLDFKLWHSHLIEHGIVAMHDSFCGWPGAGKIALNKIVKSNKFNKIGVVGSIIYGIKGKTNFVDKINLLRNRLLIIFAFKLNNQKNISNNIKFFLIHRIIKLLLINRFTFRKF